MFAVVQPVAGSRKVRLRGFLFACAVVLSLVPHHGAYGATTLRVGTYANEPLVFVDERSLPQGVYIDILEHIARQEGWVLRYVNGTWEESLERLRNARIDLLVAIGYSAEQRRFLDFTRESVLVNWGQVYIRKGSPIASLLDLTGRKLAVVRKDIYYEAFKSTHAILNIHPEFVEVDAYRAPLALLAAGKADAALVPRIFGAYHEREFDIQKSAIMFSPVELRFAVPKGKHAEILAALDTHLAGLKADKRSIYYQSLNQWVEGVQTLAARF